MIERSPFSQRPLYRSGPANENGAVAPATPRAAAPTPAFFSRSRLVIGRSTGDRPSDSGMSLPPFLLVSLAERSAGESHDEAVKKRVVDQRQRDARQQARG